MPNAVAYEADGRRLCDGVFDSDRRTAFEPSIRAPLRPPLHAYSCTRDMLNSRTVWHTTCAHRPDGKYVKKLSRHRLWITVWRRTVFFASACPGQGGRVIAQFLSPVTAEQSARRYCATSMHPVVSYYTTFSLRLNDENGASNVFRRYAVFNRFLWPRAKYTKV